MLQILARKSPDFPKGLKDGRGGVNRLNTFGDLSLRENRLNSVEQDAAED